MTKKINPLVYICIILSILYIFLAVHPLSKEIHFSTIWTVDSTKASSDINEIDKESLISFKLGQTAGYFTPEGKICFVFTFPYKASVTDNEYCTYGTSDLPIPIFAADGLSKGIIKASGFPFFQENRKFLMLPGGNSFSCLSDTGEELWKYEYYTPITAFSSSKSGTVCGFTDGTILVFNNDGEVIQQYAPGGSEFPVILGAAISENGDYTACISGQKPQRFILAKKEKGMTKISYHEYLEADTNRQQIIKFSKKTDYCYFAHKDCLGVLDIKKGKTKHIPIKGTILSICETGDQNEVFILSHEGETYHVSLLQNNEIYTGKFSFKARNAFITTKDNLLFVGKDSSISCIKITKN